MNSTNIRISGNHINELSENIPSNIFALNELIKNSYDACASYCEIKIDKRSNEIIIQDNGKGFDEESIRELFHLSKSSKKYGQLQSCGDSKRRVQGSKGLGFLAAFRFGHNVRWQTGDGEKSYVFSVSKNDLTNLDDISEYQIRIDVEKANEGGTKIIIDSERTVIDQVLDYFSDASNYLKLVGAFNDDGFEVILSLPSGDKKTSLIPKIKDINPNDQLFYVRYTSESGLMEFYKNGYLEAQEWKQLSSDEYEINIEIMIYSLRSYGRDKVSKYFHKPGGGAITPLVFLNGNLFNNYTLFDADIFRSKRSESALPQMIGYVNVVSESQYFEFNSDRTNFVENGVTLALSEDLENINKLIQETGSKIKSKAKEKGGNLTGPAYPKRGGARQTKPLVKAKVELSRTEHRIKIPSEQIDLLDYLKSVTNSEGEPVHYADVEIKVDNKAVKNNIVPSVESPCRMVVSYIFNDPNTSKVIETLNLVFDERKGSVTGSRKAVGLFYIPGSDKDYKISIEHVAKIMEQISEAHENSPRFSYLIACSLRTVFELSSMAVADKRARVFTHNFMEAQNAKKSESSKKVVQVVQFIKSNNELMTKVAEVLGLGYRNLKKFLDINEFEEKFDRANLGAHSGAQFLSASSIQDIAKIAGYYAAFCDALIYHVSDNLIAKAEIVDI
jgi:hypothetical protein